jgi:hypothetical protein
VSTLIRKCILGLPNGSCVVRAPAVSRRFSRNSLARVYQGVGATSRYTIAVEHLLLCVEVM